MRLYRRLGSEVEGRDIGIILDQAVYAASNVLPMLLVAQVSNPAEYGRLAVLYAGSVLLITSTRSTYGEAALGSAQESEHRFAGRFRAVLYGLATACAATYLAAGGAAILAVISVPLLYVMVCQDQLRAIAVQQGRVRAVLAADLGWLVLSCTGGAAATSIEALATPEVAFLAWELGGLFSYLILHWQFARRGPGNVDGSRAPQTSLLSIYSANLAVAVAVFAIAPITLAVAGADDAGYLRMAQLAVAPATLLAVSAAPMLLPRWSRSPSRAARARGTELLFFVASVVFTAVLATVVVTQHELLFPNAELDQLRLAVLWSACLSCFNVVGILLNLRLKLLGRLKFYTRLRGAFAVATVGGTLVGAFSGGVAGVLIGNTLVVNGQALLAWREVRRGRRETPGL